MIALFLAPVYIVINIYIVKWLIKWLECFSKWFKNKYIKMIIVYIYILFASSFIVGFFLPVRWIRVVGNYWLGVVQYIVMTVVIADLIRIILKKCKGINQDKLSSKMTFLVGGSICILIVVTLSTYGVIHANKINDTKYEVTIDKENKLNNLRISLVSDLHLGYNSKIEHIEKMVDIINKNKSDLVVIAGDIFDNEYAAIDRDEEFINVLKKIKATYGVYAVYGNHDIEEAILAGFTFSWKNNVGTSAPEMDEFLKRANIKLLQDEVVLIDDSFYLGGRLDYHKLGIIGLEERKSPGELLKEVDKSKPIIMIDHEPKEFKELESSGVDIDLSGHTHNGQMFPSNIFGKIIWKNPYGMITVGNMKSIVTSGVGVYGPSMRVGSTAEVANILVKFRDENYE